MSKMVLDESLFQEYKEPLEESKVTESIYDGWDETLVEEPIIGRLEEFIYEINNTIKGANTGAKTYQELADYIDGLVTDLEDFADLVRSHEEDSGEGEDN